MDEDKSKYDFECEVVCAHKAHVVMLLLELHAC